MTTITMLYCPVMDGTFHMVELVDDPRPDGAVGERKPYYCSYHQRRFWEREILKAKYTDATIPEVS